MGTNQWRLAHFSSSPAAAAAATNNPPRFSTLFRNDVSDVYQQKLMSQRPTVVKWEQHLQNTVSFIGSVDLPLKVMTSKYGIKGAHTFLKVNHLTNHPDNTFRIRIAMWDDLGTMCIKHLKRHDFIYVSGPLESYTKPDHTGNTRLYYSVNVKDLNYVTQSNRHPSGEISDLSQSSGGEASMENYENNLYLWQIYFTNPYEWWDNRKSKKHPKQPDFKHKDTKEALWIMPNDPPWVKRQLELLDSRLENQGLREDPGRRSRVAMWTFDE
ncbi:hypothetical protein ACFE04_004218 [Oxalis oulophora]